MRVIVEVGHDLHFFEAIAISVEGQEITISLPDHELAIVPVTDEEERKRVIAQIKDLREPVYIKAKTIRYTHIAVIVEVGGD